MSFIFLSCLSLESVLTLPVIQLIIMSLAHLTYFYRKKPADLMCYVCMCMQG